MTKILFVCHGNICRSPMAELLMKDMVKKAGREEEFFIDSAATSYEEIGNPVYPPARRMLAAHGIGCEGKTARHLRQQDYEEFDLLIGMDEENRTVMQRYFGGDAEGKIKNLLDYAGREGEEVADPWYTGDFQATWDDLSEGCAALLSALTGAVLDFSGCEAKEDFYDELRRRLPCPAYMGNNLDALWDVLTERKSEEESLTVLLPAEGHPLRGYAGMICEVLRESGKKVVVK